MRLLFVIASWEGFEPPTDGLEGHCSIQLSYQDIFNTRIIISKYMSFSNRYLIKIIYIFHYNRGFIHKC